MLAVTNAGARIFRNQVGLGWQGEIHRISQRRQIYVLPGDVVIRNARALKSGLCNGASDLIGWKTIEVIPDMVGRQVAIFTAIETKSEAGVLSDDQHNFLEQVRKAGGIGIEARDPGDAATIVKYWPGPAYSE